MILGNILELMIKEMVGEQPTKKAVINIGQYVFIKKNYQTNLIFFLEFIKSVGQKHVQSSIFEIKQGIGQVLYLWVKMLEDLAEC